VDSATPPPSSASSAPANAPYVYAATDERPRTPRERELCRAASTFDWLYWGTTVAATAGAITLDVLTIHTSNETAVRLTGPGLIGLTWGSVLGGGYLSLPKCEPGLVRSGPPEGDVHKTWPGAVAIALLAGVTAPLVVGIETGSGASTLSWSTEERAGRLITAGLAGFGGALVPYLLPPRTWRAAKKLEEIRMGADTRGAFLSYSLRF
jgi:hypothetical protein